MDTSIRTSPLDVRPPWAPPGPPAFDPRRPPVRGFYGEHPIPDLSRIPQEHWVDVLIHAHPETYGAACEDLPPGTIRAALIARGQALMERPLPEARPVPVAAYEAAASPRTIPRIDVARPAAERFRQVNFRLSSAEYARLEQTARLLGLRPSAAARVLVVRSVQQVLREADGAGE
jgi:hypothetical protein